MVNLPPEKLGSFYLGARYDTEKSETTNEAVNYDARDLCTHAVCVGMTGSGKTGLCVGLLEEAALDKVPAIIIDPKGDMTNLLLQFKDLNPEDFKPWINPDDASRKGKTIDEYAESTSKMWAEGIASWGQDKSRIADLSNSVDYTIYTPGSTAGIQVNILGSFAAPKISFDEDAEILRDRIEGIVSALMGMVGNTGDPVRSREGVLLANLFEYHWKKGEDLDLAMLINGIQNPPMTKLGVFDVETFYPSKDRFELAMQFNSLIASPQFKSWLEGTPMDIDKLYFTEEGKPRHSIFYIAHLSDSERMFFVTLLLNSLISWMRQQSGTTSLRSLLYFDEIFGYFPPTANPPSKKPLMTILKQARAFGVGAVLVTQNPVDIDYKGLSNAGTWFIGKLQTERDKMRVLEGLEGAISQAGQEERQDYSKLISGLGSRVFLMHNINEEEPIVFHTRWVLSYLRGPMTRPQVQSLMEGKKTKPLTEQKTVTRQGTATSTNSESASSMPPGLDPSIDQRFYLPLDNLKAGDDILMNAKVLALAKLRFVDKKLDYDEVEEINFLLNPPDDFGRLDWESAFQPDNLKNNLSEKPLEIPGIKINYGSVPESINTAKKYKDLESEISDYLYHNYKRVLLEHDDLEIVQKQGESKESFMMRVSMAAKERRDEEMDKLRSSYEKNLDKIEDKIRKEQRDLDDAQSEAQSRKQDEWMNIAETVFSVLGSRRKRSFSTVSTKRRMARRAGDRVENIREEIEDMELDLKDLNAELKTKLEDIRNHWIDQEEHFTKKEITPRRSDVMIDNVSLCWTK